VQIAALRQSIAALVAPPVEVYAAYLYGSAVRAGDVGDVDVALLVDDDTTLDAGLFGGIVVGLERAIGNAGPEVDLRCVRPRLASFAHEVFATGLLLWERSTAERAWLEARCEARYLDEKVLQYIARRARERGPHAA